MEQIGIDWNSNCNPYLYSAATYFFFTNCEYCDVRFLLSFSCTARLPAITTPWRLEPLEHRSSPWHGGDRCPRRALHKLRQRLKQFSSLVYSAGFYGILYVFLTFYNYNYSHIMLFMDQLVSDLVSSWWINWAERMLNLRNLWINQLQKDPLLKEHLEFSIFVKQVKVMLCDFYSFFYLVFVQT